MPVVVGVSFKKVGKIYYFDPGDHELREGDFVIAETARGVEFGEVMIEPREVPEEEIVPPLKKIVRKATPADMEREELNRRKEKDAFSICQEKIHAHNLPMKLIDAEYCFDGSQITFYFSAESRVDFRELVKDLAHTLRCKVQLHQVGVRDEAKLFGGMGPCGRVLCCSSFLCGFEPVSMKMAKEQSLFLNPLKFSGICGKLMCCLKYEYPIYKEAKSRLPAVGTQVETPKGPGKVVEVNVIKETVGVELEGGVVLHYTMNDLVQPATPCPAAQSGCNGCGTQEVIEVQTGEDEEDEAEPETAVEDASSSPLQDDAVASAEQPTVTESKRRKRGRRSGRGRNNKRSNGSKNESK